MRRFATVRLPSTPDEVAPDGADVRLLCTLAAGAMVHFELAAGMTSAAVTHRSVEEIWFVVSGRGEMWRRQGAQEDVVALEPGVCLTVPLGTHFQFRSSPSEAVTILCVTMPPWPGADEAIAVVGPWQPTLV